MNGGLVTVAHRSGDLRQTVNSQLLGSGIDMGAGRLPMHSMKVFKALRKSGYAETQLTGPTYNSQW
jgi:hypothetical protein